MDQSAVKKPLRFGCPACGIRLVVDQSIAGTEGPCPSCGARIVAPPIEAAQSLVEKKAAPVAIKPRPVTSHSDDTNADSQQSVEAALDAACQSLDEDHITGASAEIPHRGPTPSPVSRSSQRRRSVNPTTMVSRKHAEKQNTLLFLKILIAVLVVAAIAFGTYYILKNAA